MHKFAYVSVMKYFEYSDIVTDSKNSVPSVDSLDHITEKRPYSLDYITQMD